MYNDAAEKTGKPGRMHGIQGDIRFKVRSLTRSAPLYQVAPTQYALFTPPQAEALRLADEVGKREQHVTALFNNAGIMAGQFAPPAAPTAAAFRAAYFDPITEEDFDLSLRTNAVGPYWLTFAFLPLLERWKAAAGGARVAPQVVMTSSMNGWTKDPRTAGRSFPYMFSKAALGHATAALAHELLPLGIRVNGIAPGASVLACAHSTSVVLRARS